MWSRKSSWPFAWLTEAEDEALLAHAGTPNEIILTSLLRHTGLRVDEARSLALKDLDLSGRPATLRVLVSKTPAGRRTIPLAPELLPQLYAWFDHLERSGLYYPTGPLLSTKNGTPMESTYIWRVIKRAAFKAGVRPVPCTCGAPTTAWHAKSCPRTSSGEHLSEISPHTLRRTYGSSLINRGMPIESISKLMGHTSVAITQKYYAELLDEKVSADYFKALGYSQPRWTADYVRPKSRSAA